VSGPAVIRVPARAVGRLLRAVAIVAGVVVFGAGVPLLWVWVGSMMQGGTAPSMSGLGVALGGIVVSYTVLAALFAWIVERSRSEDRPVRYAWNRSLSAERHHPGRTTHALEEVVVMATLLVGLACTVFFFLFGSPGTPVGAG